MRLFTTIAAASLLLTSTAMANPNIMFIVDASGSMKEKVDDKSRMDAAKEVLISTLGKMPADANLGLLVYGHRKAKDCTDIELVSPLGGDDAKKLQTTVSGLSAKGETPIADAIKEASKSFAAFKGQKNKIILVTDGLEECKGDPCAAAKEVKDQGLEVAVDVVGFTLGDEEAKAVQCITEATGGKYYDAPDAETLTAALEEAAEPVAAPEPVQTVAFEDTFDGKGLNPHWEVKNENKENYIVEDGKITIIMPGKQIMPLADEAFPNLFQATEAMPEGDWTLEVVFDNEVHTSRERIYFGVMDDTKNFISVGVRSLDAGTSAMVDAILEKVEDGTPTVSKKAITWSNGYHYFPNIEKTYNDNIGTITATLKKVGREYFATFKYMEGEEEKTIELESLKMLRPKSKLFFAISQDDHGGDAYLDGQPLESYVNIDSVKVTASE
ncbi:MAG: VWA domain-containing protein [Alphaproteobacteria bacterium]|nr:VWA domain-containing protein [Alphaproteobacteria bacterium]MCD8519721.1 VWA domain-containing protein [Alphaproteobacteria bacterium]